MKAGRELDALIAEKVFDSKKPTHKHDRVHLESMNDATFCWECFCIYAHGDVCEWYPRKFSTQIADTKLVWEKFQFVSIETCGDKWKAELSPKNEGLYWALADTIEEATCLAALKAVEGGDV